MIYLYIKTHNKTNLKYFGKTTQENPHVYKGSGKYWKSHIKKHGYDVSTYIYKVFNDDEYEECKCEAEKFSRENNIVESNEWANLKPESLDGGWDHYNCIPKEIRTERIKEAYKRKTKKEIEEINKKKANKGEDNYWYGRDRSGDNNPRYGYNLSDSQKDKISKANKNKIVVKDKETNKTIGLIDKNHKNILNGKWVSINTGRKHSEQHRRHLSEIRKKSGIKPPSSKGLLWWNNGISQKRSKECPGEEWKRGRLPFKKHT